MKTFLVIIVMSAMMFASCGSSKESASIMADTTISANTNPDLPYQDIDRTRGSVSPNAEERNTYNNGGVQGPNKTNGTIAQQELEPLRSRNTRSYNKIVTPYNNGGGEPNMSNRKNP